MHEDQKNKKTDDDSMRCFPGAVAVPHSNLGLLNSTVLVLFAALLVVVVMLFYFVRKKVTMTGPACVSRHARRVVSERCVFSTETQVSAPAPDDPDGRPQRQ